MLGICGPDAAARAGARSGVGRDAAARQGPARPGAHRFLGEDRTMPDPRLVSRAQRAATMLERAWERWRVTQGLEAEPLPPVSSYVGYSIEEPWGRPRVVFGVDAEDAERLAALLQHSIGHGPDGLPGPADAGYRPSSRGGFAADRPAGPDRGYDQSLLDDVRGRIPVQGWPPEFSESREQLNSSGPSHPDEPQLPLDLGPAQADSGAGEPFRWEPDRPHDLKLPGELGLSDEFRASDDFLDDQPGLFGGDALNGDARYGDARYGNAPHGDVRHVDVRHENAPYENAPYGDAPYGVPYAGDAPYAVPYTGEPYDPEGPYGPYGRGESDDVPGGSGAPDHYGAPGTYGAAGGHEVPGGAPRGYSTPGGYSASSGYSTPGGYSAPGGYGGPGPHRAEDESANGSREASYRAPGTSELPESDGQSGQPSWALNGGAPRDAKPDEGAAATAEVRPEPGHDDVLPDGESERDKATEDVPTGDVSMRPESVRAESVRAGEMPDADEPGGDEPSGDEPGGDMRGGDEGPGDDTPDPNAEAGKHMLAGDVAPQKDAHGSDAFSGGTPSGGTPSGAAPSGKAWGEKPWGEKTLSRDAGPDETPPAADQPAGGSPGAPRAAADRTADPASRGSITDTMAAELAGWAAGELPGQAAARLASWATAGGAVARGRQQARLGGGGTATERAS
jgi:hypothetical protein